MKRTILKIMAIVFLGSLIKMESRMIYSITAAVRFLSNGVRNLKAEKS